MAFTTTIPILGILDETKSREFYVDFLGFQVDWEHRAEGPLYMQVSLDECVLHLSEHSGDAKPGAAVKLYTDTYSARVSRPRRIHRPKASHSAPEETFGQRRGFEYKTQAPGG